MAKAKSQTKNIFTWIDNNTHKKSVRLINQFTPIIVCSILLVFFVLTSLFLIESVINPLSVQKIQVELHLKDLLVGFFLYFVTAVDYALVIGRMQVSNPGSKKRLVMNIFTCLGGFAGVTVVLFLWSFAKEISWLIIPILLFAGSIMIKLGYEGIEYFEHSKSVPLFLRKTVAKIFRTLYSITNVLTFWVPELSSPKTKKMSIKTLGTWSFVLPFIIGLDDFIGYMGAMTIYNVFSLLIGIYLADVFIDILIFTSPSFTKKMVESAILSLLAAGAFLYLAYKSYSESFILLHEAYHLQTPVLIALAAVMILSGIIFSANYKKAEIAK